MKTFLIFSVLLTSNISAEETCVELFPEGFSHERAGNDRDFFCSLAASDDKVAQGERNCNEASEAFKLVLDEYLKGDDERVRVSLDYPTYGEAPKIEGLSIPENKKIKDRDIKCGIKENNLECAVYLYPNFHTDKPQSYPLKGLSKCIVSSQPENLRKSISIRGKEQQERRGELKSIHKVPEEMFRPVRLNSNPM